MVSPGDLTTLITALTRLDAGDSPDTVAKLITACSAQIQNIIGYQVAVGSYTRNFNGGGSDRLMLPDRPVVSVTAVTISGVTIPAAPDQISYGYLADDKTVYLRGYRFDRGFQNVSIAYTAGYSATPPDLEEACLDWVSMAFDQIGRPSDATRIRAGDTEFNYGGIGEAAFVPPSIMASIRPYIRNYPA